MLTQGGRPGRRDRAPDPVSLDQARAARRAGLCGVGGGVPPASRGEITPPTMLRTTLLGAPFKRGGTDPIHDTDLLLVDLDSLHQGPDDLPSRGPVRLL